MKSKRGFTVAELLIVTCILLVIAVLSFSAVFGKIQQAKDIAADATIHNILSMYRMAEGFAKLDTTLSQKKPNAAAHIIELPIKPGATASTYERFINKAMHSGFAALDNMRYSLTENINGEIVIIYWPLPDSEKHYMYENGQTVRITP